MTTEISAKEALQCWVRALEAVKIMEDRPGVTLPGLIAELAATHGGRPALIGEGGRLSYTALDLSVRHYAGWAQAQKLAPGEVVALLLPNSPDYAAIWLGLGLAGCVTALINTNLAGPALAHCIRAAGARHIIAGADLVAPLRELGGELAAEIWVHGGEAAGLRRVDAGQPAPYMPAAPATAPHDVALLIYTSGTTGLPKAANVTHARLVEWAFWFAGMMDVRPEDRLYDCLPMYHSTGGVVAVGAMLVRGGAVVIREKFSARRFWDDVIDEHCTIFQYIGELCRYLTASPPHPRETQHSLRLCCGNGMGGAVWKVFEERFKIPRILEFYAATEGSVSLYNCEGKAGAIGRVPPFLAARFPVALIRCDDETGAPLRDDAGFCIKCQPDEPGEAIGKILGSAQAPSRQFDGYTDEAASARKILTDVFQTGDRWFRTGDLMRKDRAGYYYFLDRLGDTFRWKGENVSTTEVAAVAAACPGVTQAVVFGVAVTGHEGRAGMAALTVDGGFSLATLWQWLAAGLPPYAQPLFVRICDAFEVTGTFKLRKETLAREGYDVAGAVWFNDRAAGRFVELDARLRGLIRDGAVKL